MLNGFPRAWNALLGLESVSLITALIIKLFVTHIPHLLPSNERQSFMSGHSNKVNDQLPATASPPCPGGQQFAGVSLITNFGS